MAIDTSSAFGPDEIMDYIGQFEQMRTAKSADARAERISVLQEANMKFQQDTARKTQGMREGYLTHTAEGLDWESITSNDTNKMFGGALPDISSQLAKMDSVSKSYGTSFDTGEFLAGVQSNRQKYMSFVANRFKAQKEALENTPYANPTDIASVLTNDYHGRNVYNNLLDSGFDDLTASKMLGGYKPGPRKATWGEWAESWYRDPEIAGKGGGISPGKIAGYGGTAIGTAAVTAWGSAKILDTYKDYADIKNKDLDSIKNLQKKIGYEKELKTLGPESAKDLGKYQKELTELNKKLADKYPKSEAAKKWAGKGLRGARNIGLFAASRYGTGKLGEIAGGDLGREVGEIAGTAGAPAVNKIAKNIYSKVKKLGTRRALELIAKKGGWKLAASVAGKGALGAIGTPFSGGVSAAISGGLLVKDLVDIYNILNEEG